MDIIQRVHSLQIQSTRKTFMKTTQPIELDEKKKEYA